jgi:hypothetical protein
MPPVFEDKKVAKGTHAFLIGVGDYPFAKPDKGTNPKLRNVRDLPSAADSAKLMADWLLDNRASLQPPLASLDILVSDVPASGDRYQPHNPELQGAFERAEGAVVKAAGEAWLERLQADPGGTALFYACGHGANLSNQPVLFLSDLNRKGGGDAWTHLNLRKIASAFRQLQHVAKAIFFLDACGEFVPYFPPDASDSNFISPDVPSGTDRDKVLLLAAASAGLLAHPGETTDFSQVDPEYEGADPADKTSLKFGRFTLTLLKGLRGASARWDGEAWTVETSGLVSDLKPLHRTYFPHWADKPFEPSQAIPPNDPLTIVGHAAPRVPVVISTVPSARMAEFDLKIGESKDGAAPWRDQRATRDATPWRTEIDGDAQVPLWALALDDGGSCHADLFTAKGPSFNQKVVIK